MLIPVSPMQVDAFLLEAQIKLVEFADLHGSLSRRMICSAYSGWPKLNCHSTFEFFFKYSLSSGRFSIRFSKPNPDEKYFMLALTESILRPIKQANETPVSFENGLSISTIAKSFSGFFACSEK